MKKSLLALLIVLTSLGVKSATHKIIKIHAPGEFGDHYSLFMNNGEIFDLDKSNIESLSIIEDSIISSSDVELDLSKSSESEVKRTLVLKAKAIDSISVEIDRSENTTFSNTKEYYTPRRYDRLRISSRNPLSNYNLTKFTSYDVAQEVMNVFNGDTHIDSQCYARAHMWTYEAFLKYGDNLGKVWIFFANKYIREFGHKWWFHVAPYTLVQGYSMPMVLDRGFTTSPYQLNNWKNIFIKNKASCRTINRYSEYTRNTNNEYCFLMFSSAYYWQPRDLESLGKSGYFRWGYVLKDLDWSYNNALGTRGRKAPYARGRENHNAYRN